MTENKPAETGHIKLLFKVFKFVRPFTGLLALSILLNAIFSTLTAISIAIIQPVLEVLFPSADKAGAIGNTVQRVQNIKQLGGVKGLKDQLYDGIKSMIFSPHDLYASLFNLCLFILMIFVVKNIFKYMGSVVGTRLEEGIVKNIRDTVFRKMTDLSLEFFTRRKLGSLMSVINNDVSVVNSTTISSINGILREFIQVVLFLFLLISISPYLTFIAFSTSIISLLTIRLTLKYLRKYAQRMQAAMADYTSVIHEAIAGIRVVKAYNAEKITNKKFSDQTRKYIRSAVKHTKIIALIPSINEVFAIAALCIVLLVGGSQVFRGQMKPDELLTFLFALFAIMSPISTVFNNISQFQRGFVAAERVFDVLDQQPSVMTGSEHIDKFNEKIEIRNVNFAYKEIPVLKNVSFEINKTRKIAFVGASGSGKSTMLDLIIRFYDPIDGQIQVDGHDIDKFKLDSYRALFGIVSQETILFNDTVANNIRYGYEAATMEDIIESSKIANAYEFIMKLEHGFDTIIGDRGVMLSGGERQRIAIARALIRKPQILVFDEATSSLDAESEKIVQEAINMSLENKTAIIVAHRLATIRECDEILVFDNGKIVEKGSHNQLIEKNGVYRKLYDIQFASTPMNEEIN